jgi:hypothetical protein
MGEKRNAYRVLVGKPEEKRSLGRTRSRSVDYIKIDLRERGWGGMDWTHLAQDRDECRAFGLHETLRNSRVAERLAASKEKHIAMEFSLDISWQNTERVTLY